MALRLDDKWVWDFWHASADGLHHLFYLQAPRSLGDPELRHWNSTVGHAVSRDLLEWRVLPDALAPGAKGAWDDLSIWTGSIIEHAGIWHMLYTGTSQAERGLVQRVGLATSLDLVEWHRVGDDPVIEADSRWYELLDLDVWRDQSWRDPWVMLGPDGAFHVLLTARARAGDPRGRGVVGHAVSDDLRSWDVLEPLTEPNGFAEVEVPQVAEIDGSHYLLFCGSRQDRGGRPETGTFSLAAAGPLGPFESASIRVVETDEPGSSYAGKIIEHLGEAWFLSWERTAPDGSFVGAIGEPRRAVAGPGGELRIVESADARAAITLRARTS